MENIKVLYYLKEVESNVFYIELKRLEYKNSIDKLCKKYSAFPNYIIKDFIF